MITFMTGFEEYALGRAVGDFYFTQVTIPAGGDFTISGGRYGGHALINNLGGGNETYFLAYEDTLYDCVIGFAYKFLNSTGGGYDNVIMGIWDGANYPGAWGVPGAFPFNRIELRKLANDTLCIWAVCPNNIAGAIIGPTNQTILPNRWYYIELVLTFNNLWFNVLANAYNTTPQIQIIIDGAVAYSDTSTFLSGFLNQQHDSGSDNTAVSGIPLHSIVFHYDHFRVQNFFDDFYVIRNVGMRDNSGNLIAGQGPYLPLGEINVNTLIVDNTQPQTSGRDSWTALGSNSLGTSKADVVSEVSPDGDQSFIYASDAGSLETFKFPNMATNSDVIFGVQFAAFVKSTGNPKGMSFWIGTSGGHEIDGNIFGIQSGSQYLLASLVYDVDANTNAEWLPSAINTLEVGLYIVS